MKLKRAYIQAEGGVRASDTFFRACEGFRKRGVPCELFEPQELRQGSLPLGRDTLVAGGVPVVEDVLTALGITIPSADNLPACLARYRGRRVWASTWGELRAQYGKEGPPEPLWVKSLRRNKGTPSIAVYHADDIASASYLPGSHEVPDLKQAKALSSEGWLKLFFRLRTISVLLATKQVLAIKLCLRHEPLLFLRGRSWRRGGSEHPDSDFGRAALNTAARWPPGRRSVGEDATPTTATASVGRSARFDTAAAQRH